MFTVTTERFGTYTHLKLINTTTGEHFSFFPDFGASINHLRLQKGTKLFDLIDGSNNLEKLLGDGKRVFKGSKLFPFPNRIANGRYTFKGKAYQLPINFSSEGHAIHGLVLDKKFKIVEKNAKSNGVIVQIEYNYDGKNPGYPFPYLLRIKYTLKEIDGVICETVFKNTGVSAMPMGDGWHPYFQT